MSSHGNELSPLDWLMPQIYTRKIFCFPAEHQAGPDQIYESVKEGLTRTVRDVPFLSCGVVDGSRPRGAAALTPEPCYAIDDLLSRHDISARLQYQQLRQQNFPPSAFDGPHVFFADTLAPYPKPAPVFRASVILVSGGFILIVAFHHSLCDGASTATLMRLWASHCRNSSSDAAQSPLDPSWLDRSVVARSSLHTAALSDLASPQSPGLLQQVPPQEAPQPRIQPLVAKNPETAPEMNTAVLLFTAATLSELKASTNAHLGRVSSDWVSTGDIVTALLWSASIAAQSTRDTATSSSTHSTVGIPVNIRSALTPPLPEEYLGGAVFTAPAAALRSDLLSLASTESIASAVPFLSIVASEVRNAIRNLKDDKDGIQKMVAFMLSLDSLQGLRMTKKVDGTYFNSWSGQGFYELDWGSDVGRCEAVRVPAAASRPMSPLILPRVPDSTGEETRRGGLEVVLGFETGVLEDCVKTPVLRAFSKVICSGTPTIRLSSVS